LGEGYDIVLIPNFLHHLGTAENVAFLKRVHAALKPGGIGVTVEFAPDDSYIRAVVQVPGRTLYLNPVIRFDGVALPSPGAPLDLVWTWIIRGGILIVCALLTFSLIRRHTWWGRRRPGQSPPWRGVAALVIAMFVFTGAFAGKANAQDQEPEQDKPLPTTVVEKASLTSSFDPGLLAALPIGDNVFSVLETMQAEVIASRVSTGGVGFGSAPHLSAFGSSITQTRFRVGDVDITDPSSGAAPLLLPELFLWSSVAAATVPNRCKMRMLFSVEGRPRKTTPHGRFWFHRNGRSQPNSPPPACARPAAGHTAATLRNRGRRW